MRYVLLCMLMACMLVDARADTLQPLALSHSLVAIKLTNPDRQLTQFAPIFAEIDKLAAISAPEQGKVSEKISQGLQMLTHVPGVNTTGDFWLLILPPPPVKAIDKDVATPALAARPPMYLLVPLVNKALFAPILQADFMKNVKASAQVFDDCAVFSFATPTPPNFAGIVFDLPLISKRDLVIVGKVDNAPLRALYDGAGMENARIALKPMLESALELQQNVQSYEIGLAMIDGDLSLESYAVPVPHSPLAQQLVAPMPAPGLLELAALLPEDLSLCAVTGAKLPGSHGPEMLGQALMEVISTGVNSSGGHSTLNLKWAALTSLCSQGYALGISSPAMDQPSPASIVGIFQTDAPKKLKPAMDAFFQELCTTRDSFGNDQLAQMLQVESKPSSEIDGGIPVDMVKITLLTDAAAAAAGKDGKPFTLICRFAYRNAQMLLTIGTDSKARMADLIARVQRKTPGFTAGKRFASLKAVLPEHPLAFGCLAPLELLRAGINLLPLAADQKTDGLGWLHDFPPISAAMRYHLEALDARLHADAVIPQAQLDQLFAVLEKIAKQAAATKATTKPEPATVLH